ncbi:MULTISPECIES: YuzD family protein [Bacillus]|uniref:Disulfide oxidoreductase n=2 Tax=Bacillus TaxID=1386 RepID=A0A0M4FKG5_9BACI|nr:MULTISPECIES: YuzD family protein [Bacillus]ALC82241.1 disulfide oxidoreductase [Bacillus gobiensis]MBP1081093.1 disulfide oxidoreductase YuzD [Bacillus capparidis]MED1095781.1 YuzD family protein [Bacillus capparidis]
MSKQVELSVYGAEVLCASCVNMPSAKETYEWLEAALKRKYPDQPFTISYVDIQEPQNDQKKEDIAEQVRNEKYFYPLVLVEDTVVGEGDIRLKNVFSEMEKHGYAAK